MKMKIGAQGYTIRDFVKDEKGVSDSLAKLHAMGYEYLQVSAFCEMKAQRLKEIADENKLEIVITHTNPTLILENTDAVIDAHKALGCSYVGIGCMPLKYQTGIDGMREFLKDYDHPARALREAGMKLEYHNHSLEYGKLDGKIMLDRLAEETDPTLWGFTLDVFWTQLGGRCPARQIEMLKGRIDVCHLKDLALVDGKPQTAAVLDGNICFDEILFACESTGVKYAMVEQDDTYGKNPFDELELSLRNLKRLEKLIDERGGCQ